MKKLFFLLFALVSFGSKAQLADSTRRLVHVRGAYNFRDVGGYLTTDGRRVKWNRIYRSASIQKLTDGDMDTLRARQIYTVIDFRGKEEAAAAPDRLLPQAAYTLSPAGSDAALQSGERMAALFKGNGFLEDFYGKGGIPYFGERYRPLFQQLLALNDTTSLLYHCTGGRDRTGMATALFLYALGVPRTTIDADFTASNVYLRPMMGPMMKPLAAQTGLTSEQLAAKMELRPELLTAFFQALQEKYGSVELFMEKELGIGEKERKMLKEKYTE
ncbi:MAG: tyrosine-protein phosphatase [Siphonobacter aquaeclarae]|nr:tyrosine-protein phosphatase [Siphonobacter aquaeclarae]